MKLAPLAGTTVWVRPTTDKAVKRYGTGMVKAEVVENYQGHPEAYRVRFPDGTEETYVGVFFDLTV